MGRKRITGDELDARAKANGYQREAHGKRTVVEAAISTATVPRKIKIPYLALLFPPILQPPQ
jgi:hypothetical protein